MFIKGVTARIIKDSRKEDTIEIEIKTLKGIVKASAPYGKSKGKYERPAYNERGPVWTLKLAKNFSLRFRGLLNFTRFEDLNDVEEEIKKFERDFGRLGANFTYAFEAALLKAAARERDIELWELVAAGRGIKIPAPIGNCIGGGMHTSGKKPDFQEFLLAPDEKNFHKAVIKNLRAYEYAKKVLKRREKVFILKKNDESAWHSTLSNEETLRVLEELRQDFGLRAGVDFASSTFFNKTYNYRNKEMIRNREEQIEYILALARRYGLFYLEDPMQEEDFLGFAKLHGELGDKHLIVGDDLTATNLERVKHAYQLKAVNGVIIKPNQSGSLVEVAKICDFCTKNGIKTIFSHRSGETMDTTLADLAVGFGADFIKCGIYGKERLAKLGRLIQIEKSLGLS
jgi:enolase